MLTDSFRLWLLRVLFPDRVAAEQRAVELAMVVEERLQLLAASSHQHTFTAPSDLLATLQRLDSLTLTLSQMPQSARSNLALELSVQPVEPEPPPLGTELIKLVDWVLMARDEPEASADDLLQALDRRLRNMLARAGFEPIETTGRYDHRSQRVVETQLTDDPALHDTIFATVRPGYRFDGRVIRPQDVVVYSCQPM